MRPYLLLLFLFNPAFEDNPDDTILRPTAQSAIPAGPFTVIARGSAGAALTLDGNAVAVARREKTNALTATIDAPVGVHELKLGSRTVRFAVVAKDDKAPDGFRPFRNHPKEATCETCHAVNASTWEIKGGTPGDSCFTCHKADTFPAKHDHKPDVLKDCGWCHSTHGSSEAGHLKMTRKQACKLCHE